MHPARVEADQVGFGFNPAEPLFSGLSFCLPGSGVSLVQGGESRGKSTLLRLLAGQLQPLTGTLRMNGLALHDPVLQPFIYAHDTRLPRWSELTPMDFFAQLATLYPGFDDAKVSPLLEHLQLAEHAHKAMYMLSTGSKRKVSWVAAMACGADLLLMDEPFAALDLTSIRKLQQLLAGWSQDHPSAWVLADYQAPGPVPLAAVIDLGD